MKELVFNDDVIRSIFGHEAAEDDDVERLKKYYFKNAAYERLQSSNPLRILIGHKGIGKSALLTVAAQEDVAANKLSIFLRPDDISTIHFDSKDLLSLIREWKEGLLKIIREKVAEYFAVRDILPHETGSTWSSILGDFAGTISDWISQKKINLDRTKKAVLSSFCRDNVIRIYVDDLDRGWTASAQNVLSMSAMLNAMRDVARDYKNVRFIVSLRSDVFYLVRTSDESTDKLESACIWFSWTNHEILAMLIKRIKTYFGKECPSDQTLIAQHQSVLASDLKFVMSDRFNGRGEWENIPTYRMLMTLIRRRPRDLVKLCTLAARHAFEVSHELIQPEDFDAIFSRYSQDRLQDTINEYRSELPQIQELLENMKPSKKSRMERQAKRTGGAFSFSTAEMLTKLKNIGMSHPFRFYGKATNATERELLNFLYKIGFVTARKCLSSGKILRHYFEEQNYVSSVFADYWYDLEVHPAFRWALAPSDSEILAQIEPLDEG